MFGDDVGVRVVEIRVEPVLDAGGVRTRTGVAVVAVDEDVRARSVGNELERPVADRMRRKGGGVGVEARGQWG